MKKESAGAENRRKKVRRESVTFSPVECMHVLEHRNNRNRKVRESLVYKYAREMSSGEWEYGLGDPIRFDWDGNMIDGQHRMWACVVSGVPLQVDVIYDLDPAVQSRIDSGAQRTHSDTLSMRGDSHATIRSSLIKNFLRIDAPSVYSKDELTRFHDIHIDAVNFVIDNFHRWRIRSITQTSIGAAVMRAWHYYDNTDKLARFCEVLRDGVSTGPEESAAIRLRDFLLRGREKGVRRNRRQLALKAQAAIRAFMRGQSLQYLHEPQHQLFPLPETDPVTGIKHGATARSVRHYRGKYPPSQLPKSHSHLKTAAKKSLATFEARRRETDARARRDKES